MQERKAKMPKCFTEVISWGREYRQWYLFLCIFWGIILIKDLNRLPLGRLGRANKVLHIGQFVHSKRCVIIIQSQYIFAGLELQKGRQQLWRRVAVKWSRHWTLCWLGREAWVCGRKWVLVTQQGGNRVDCCQEPTLLSKTHLGSISYSTSK